MSAPTPFAMCLAAFNAAKAAFYSHQQLCQPADAAHDEVIRAYEHSYAPLVAAMSSASLAVVRCPVSSASELADKLEVFKAEEMEDFEDIDDLLDVLIADARRIGGAA